jgi:hypothetical protein
MASRGWTKFENQFDLPLDDKKEKETLPLSKHKAKDESIRDRDNTNSSNVSKRERDNSGAGLIPSTQMTSMNNNINVSSNNNVNISRISKTNYNALEELRRGTPLLKYPQHFEGKITIALNIVVHCTNVIIICI